MPRQRVHRRRAFTLIEVIVVIGIIAVLAGLLVSGIRSAIARARKLREETALKALSVGWTIYSNQNGGRVLPGFAEMQPNPTDSCGQVVTLHGGTKVPWYLCQTYPFRLLPFLDYQTSVLWDGMDDEALMSAPTADWQPNPAALPNVIASAWGKPGSAAAFQPNFGYNAYYIGGWVDKRPTNGSLACWQATTHSQWQDKNGVVQEGDLVLTNSNQARNPDKLIAFATSTYRTRGHYSGNDASEDHAPGAAWVVPPALGHNEMWNAGGSVHMMNVQSGAASFALLPQADTPSAPIDSGTIVVSMDHAVPIRRNSSRTSVLTCDGSIQSHSPADLMDMQRWINQAWHANFRHNDDPGTGPLASP